eukprot:TRINITY_DN90553_c0_g1_i1.p1 TRINITY_DN90553_c0_g1~~TRINITY_DN90553_c0_g1_i1.p1  ORF type:complete len:429 (-),score=40.79 TRINITY_DN90553_c0_g1_i1:36-1322(-)
MATHIRKPIDHKTYVDAYTEAFLKLTRYPTLLRSKFRNQAADVGMYLKVMLSNFEKVHEGKEFNAALSIPFSGKGPEAASKLVERLGGRDFWLWNPNGASFLDLYRQLAGLSIHQSSRRYDPHWASAVTMMFCLFADKHGSDTDRTHRMFVNFFQFADEGTLQEAKEFFGTKATTYTNIYHELSWTGQYVAALYAAGDQVVYVEGSRGGSIQTGPGQQFEKTYATSIGAGIFKVSIQLDAEPTNDSIDGAIDSVICKSPDYYSDALEILCMESTEGDLSVARTRRTQRGGMFVSVDVYKKDDPGKIVKYVVGSTLGGDSIGTSFGATKLMIPWNPSLAIQISPLGLAEDFTDSIYAHATASKGKVDQAARTEAAAADGGMVFVHPDDPSTWFYRRMRSFDVLFKIVMRNFQMHIWYDKDVVRCPEAEK